MPKKILCFCLLTLLLVSKNVLADWYVGGLYTFTFIDLDLPTGEEFNPTALILKGGYDLHKYLALEVRAGTGITEGKRENLGIQRSVDINTSYGGYLKLQTGDRDINPYIMIGYTKAELEASNGVTTAKADDDGTSYGFGIEGPLSDGIFFNLEFMRYFDEDNVTVDGVGLGITARY